MSDPDRALPIRKILVALDTFPHSMAALEAAAELAARLQAELQGLFVEDVELLRFADAPFAREIHSSGKHGPLSRASMESKLRAQSARAKKALAAAAEKSKVPWSFRSVRGHVAPEVLAAAREADLLAMGKSGASLGKRGRIGSTARQAAKCPIPVYLLPERGVPPGARLLVHYDASPAAKGRLRAAAQLARPGVTGLVVLLATTDRDRALKMQDEVEALLEGMQLEVRYRQVDPKDEQSLLRVLKAERAGILVLSGKEFFEKFELLEELLREIQTALLLLGEETEREAA